MLTLITYPGGFGEPSLSPFCVKAEYLLNLSGQAWQREDSNDPRKAPRQKFPVLRTDDQLIHDSDTIRHYLEQHGADFDAGLTPTERAASRAFLRMAEEHLYFVLVLDRWERDDVWPIIRQTYFHEIPAVLRRLIANGLRRTLLRGLAAQGLGRLTWEERMARVEQDLEAISIRLWESPFLFGDRPTSADASIAAILGAMMATPKPTPLSKRIADDEQLRDYVARAREAMGSA